MADTAVADVPLQSVHTTSLPEFLEQTGQSFLVSTYQACKLIIARADGGVLNTHFRGFDTPMGVAFDRGRLAIGTKLHVCEFHNQAEVARQLEPPGKHDACFLPRHAIVTGQIGIHEISWVPSPTPGGAPELWAVNTQFSCLCTFDPNYSFVPRWRPKFVTSLAPGDRCHLNGMGLRDGRVRYVTALGETNEGGGWRPNKARGGVLIDIDSNEIISRGLSMPHSPRWYQDRLWILESGAGTLALVDLVTGKLQTVAELPGFTRGLEFVGPYAFIGLSQVRESAMFSGIPITERLPAEQRCCGVWVVDTRNGQTVAFLRFDAGVQEVFAIQMLPARYPDVLTDDHPSVPNAFVLPDEAMAEVGK